MTSAKTDMAMNKLDALAMPLVGFNLIEASAGTGKTYTITTLYLRLLLGLALPNQPTDGLSVDRILVVTFTEAATEEIRDRVRRRLTEAKLAIYFRDQPTHKADPLLTDLISQLTDVELAYKRLDAAIKMMDEAAIFTIHGFCQRMLKQHAFESGSLFDNEFILDESAYLQKSVKDFWRRTVYPLADIELTLFLKNWLSPQALLRDIRSLLNKQDAQCIPQIDGARLKQQVVDYGEKVQTLKQLWLTDNIAGLINDAVAKGDLMASRKPAKGEYLEAFSHFCQSDDRFFRTASGDSWGLWTPEGLTKAVKKGKTPPAHAIFALFAEVDDLQTTINDHFKAYYKQKAFFDVQQNLQVEKQSEQKISPDDLLSHLARALRDDHKGPTLAARIAAQYPVAMIDEFQDTDPLQYQIFHTIYGSAPLASAEQAPTDPSKDATMIMIGDPKQAIYGFRGADIFTYIQAKAAVNASGRYTLDTNWRSSQALIDAVNGLFNSAANPFIYQDAIPFHPVKGAAKADQTPLVIADDNGAALQIWQLLGVNNEPINKQLAINRLAEHSALEVAQLLYKAQQGQACIGTQPLSAGDICILVRDRNEAEVIRQALTRVGVSSVFLSRQSVFATPIAYDFYLLLVAIYEQKNELAIRAALITVFFDYSIEDLWALGQDEQQWQHMLEQFARLHQRWLTSGVMAVLQYLLVNNDLAGGWQQKYPNPERMLTDIRHIGELLQQKSMELDGVHRLLGWFNQQLVNGEDEGKTQQLRLEDDRNLVQIVTMHAAKGLEYNIVFLPFVCGYRAAQAAVFHQQQQLVIDFTDSDENIAKADAERLAEDLRLLYVALTRAVYRCYLGVFNLRVGAAKASRLTDTALGHLLFSQLDSVDDQTIYLRLLALQQQFHDLPSGTASCQLQQLPAEVAPPPILVDDSQTADCQMETFSGSIEYDWKVTSYSALSYGVASVNVLPGSTDEGDFLGVNVDVDKDGIDAIGGLTNGLTAFNFPKGSSPGSCLHEMFEQIDFTQFDPQDPTVATKALDKFGIDAQWAAGVSDWIADVLATPLNDQGLCLQQIDNAQRLVEMEFYLAMDKVSAWQINQILSQHLGQTIHAFEFRPVQGIVKGYIDLVVCWQGQYFIIDYKSNHLGMSIDNYAQPALAAAMAEHHYHLQYLLYTLALHRYLTLRLPHYDYETHMGGSYYLFLRGMNSQNHHYEGVYYARPSLQLINQLDQIFTAIPAEQAPGIQASVDNQATATTTTPQQFSLFGDQ